MGTTSIGGLAVALSVAGGCAQWAEQFEPKAGRTYASASVATHDPGLLSSDESSCEPGHGSYTDSGTVEVLRAVHPTFGVGGSVLLYEHHIEEHVNLAAGTGAQVETTGLGAGIEARWAPLGTRKRPLTGLTFSGSVWHVGTRTTEAIDGDADGIYDPIEVHDRRGSALGTTGSVGWALAWGDRVRFETSLGLSHAIGDNPAGLTWLLGFRLGYGF